MQNLCKRFPYTYLSVFFTLTLLTAATNFQALALDVINAQIKKSYKHSKVTTPDRKYSEYKLAYLRGTQFESKGAKDKAIESYKKSLQLKKNYLPAATNLAIILFEREQYPESLKKFYQLYTHHQKSPQALNNYALALLFKGNIKKSIQILKTGVAKFPLDYDLIFNLATAYYKGDYFNNAKRSYQKALILKKNDYPALNNLGCTHIALTEYRDAEKFFKKAIRSNNRYSQGFYNLALTYWKKNQMERAISMVTQAQSRNPDHQMAKELKKILLIKSRSILVPK